MADVDRRGDRRGGFCAGACGAGSGRRIVWALFAVVLAGVIGLAFRIAHHAEVLAVRLGEPFGTLILTVSAVAVEVIIPGGNDDPEPQPDAGARYGVLGDHARYQRHIGYRRDHRRAQAWRQQYNLDAANAYVAMLLTAVGIGMFIPDFVPAAQWQIYSVFR
jgi:Ca2+/H+ antiporter